MNKGMIAFRSLTISIALAFVGLWLSPQGRAAGRADLEDARNEFLSGHYKESIEKARASISNRRRNEDWHELWVRSLMATGQYEEAMSVMENALMQDPYSVRLRRLAYDVYLQNSRPSQAARMLLEIRVRAQQRMWAYRDPDDLVAIGEMFLLLGADPKQVLDQFLNPALESDSKTRSAYLAKGRLALDKHDFQLAAESFRAGLKEFPEDPDLLHGLAAAFAPSDRPEAIQRAGAALERNENHTPSLLLVADHLIDGEEYEAARQSLERALEVNPWHPEAWAYSAVLEHLQGDADAESAARENGLKFWTNNPAVDHLIGKKLSQKYRFAEGAEHQRQSLQFDSSYLPARIQLAQDLLRLGQEDEGWALAEAVHEADPYDVTAYNLTTLKDTLAHFVTVTNETFRVRMSAREAEIYGDRVLDLLERARERLCPKYGLELTAPVFVEIFPEQKDFGVRTFGMPDNPGFLGVCFGNVITANSPASQGGNPSNWEAVLWHEFCHVVTLNLTRNRMPRWLSEGISVYEEEKAHPLWGQPMNPHYRERILNGELTPVGELSAAFLSPKSGLDLQFAYFESGLVVEFLIQEYGLESLKQILGDLGEGTPINDAIEERTESLEALEPRFVEFAQARAKLFGPELDWEKPKDDPLANLMPEFLAPRSDNFYALLLQAKGAIEREQWEEAKAPLTRLIELCPEFAGTDSPYPLLAATHRALGETEAERGALSQWASKSADAASAYLRLMELAAREGDWLEVYQNAERMLAVNPLIPQPHRSRAVAAENLERPKEAARSYQKLLLMDPPDPADLHFRLARIMHDHDLGDAKRHVLQSLEEAPRFRDAHRLLLAIVDKDEEGRNESPDPASSP